MLGSDLDGKAAQDASTVHFKGGRVRAAGVDLDFIELVAKAYVARVQLWRDGFYATPGEELAWHPKTGALLTHAPGTRPKRSCAR